MFPETRRPTRHCLAGSMSCRATVSHDRRADTVVNCWTGPSTECDIWGPATRDALPVPDRRVGTGHPPSSTVHWCGRLLPALRRAQASPRLFNCLDSIAWAPVACCRRGCRKPCAGPPLSQLTYCCAASDTKHANPGDHLMPEAFPTQIKASSKAINPATMITKRLSRRRSHLLGAQREQITKMTPARNSTVSGSVRPELPAQLH
jgi:hypothetical protein